MLENEFEKKVREELGGLRLRPSENVWEHVESQLRKRKKRRVVVFLFMLAGLGLLGYSGYFFMNSQKQELVEQKSTLNNSNKEKTVNHNNSVSQPANENDDAKQHPQAGQPIIENNEASITQVQSSKPGGIATKPNERDVQNATATSKPALAVTPSKSKLQERRTNTRDIIAKDQNNIVSDLQKSRQKEKATTTVPRKDNKDNNEIAKSRIEENSITVAGVSTQPTATDLVKESKSAEVAQTPEPEPKDSVSSTDDSPAADTKTSEPGKLKGFSWGLQVSGGVSNSADGIFSVSPMSQQTADAFYNNAPGTGSNNVNAGLTLPSSIRRGAAFRVGVIAEKHFTKRSSVVAGLQYAYNSNHIRTGALKDTTVVFAMRSSYQPYSVNTVYSGKHEKEYKNEFHLIQLPLAYQWQVNKGENVRLLWNAGITPGYLLSTNALVYDTAAGGVHYQNEKAFQKFQLSFATGFYFSFGKKNIAWSIGPEVSLDMRRLLKDAGLPKQYMAYGGLTGRVLFNKKKK